MFRFSNYRFPARFLIIPFLIIATTGLIALPGCQGKKGEEEESADRAESSAAVTARKSALAALPEIKGLPFSQEEKSAGKFQELSAQETGIDYVNTWTIDEASKDAFGTSFIAHGVAIGDYDNDGRPDVYVTGKQDGGRLYRNLGEMKFEDVTSRVGIDPSGMWSVGAAFVDLNGDGKLDLYVYGYGCPNRLYINDGQSFTERASELGLDYNGASVCAAFADYDLDGDLDVYLVTNRLDTYRQEKLPNEPITFRDQRGRISLNPKYRERFFLMNHPTKGITHEPGGEFDHLYRNDGDRFVDVSNETKIGEIAHMGLSANWWDYNDDGLPDLYVANDFKGADILYRNNGKNHLGEYTFSNVNRDAALPHTPWFSMGSDISDVNNDGRMDYMATDMAGTNHYRDKLSMGGMSGPDSTAWFLNWPIPPQYVRNCLFLNSGTSRFMEVAFLAGLAKTDWTWTVKFDDFDNDGWEDVYFTNGMSRDWYNGDYKDTIRMKAMGKDEQVQFWIDSPPYKLENRAYKNKGDLKFADVSSKWGLDHLGVSTGAASGDLDGDGDLDLVVNGFNEPIRVYQNNVSTANSIQFRLLGTESNAEGIGARIDLEVAGQPGQMRWLAAGRGFMSSSEVVAHFGTGDSAKISKVNIRWPSGVTQTFEDLDCNQRYVIVERGSADASLASSRNEKTLFSPSEALSAFKHSEVPYDDFEREPLLPNQHSQLGSGIAWGDVNGDGFADVYLGQAAGGPGRLMLDDGTGNFTFSPQVAFASHVKSEDMGAAFFDADSDGDLDLYVASGGVECDAGAEKLKDRLYLNDGFGQFEDASDRLPDLRNSGSVVAAADFDRDGDVDLFVGSRLVVGAYPTTPESSLLLNEDGKFVEMTDDVAPGLKQAGMVTSAIWTDANDDGWLDLMLTLDWGPVELFISDQGSLKQSTAAAGLADRLGWHNSISAGDIDNDGDMDYVVGNTGLNTKYYASPEKPELLYFGDFENNGKLQIVEAKFEDGRCLPRRGLGCTSDAMPTIKEKLPTYHDFAISELVEIYSQNGLEDADKFEANNLESGILINQGNDNGVPRFEFQALPRVIQASPVFGSTLTDVDGDGNLDLYVVQNFHGPQRETGNMDGGVSMLLHGQGDGQFVVAWPDESGLVVGYDATSLTVTDLNGDARPDFVVGVNDMAPRAFLNETTGSFTRYRLDGGDQYASLVGSRISFQMVDGSTQTRSIVGGGSYLAQSPNDLFVAGQVKSVSVRWPDGDESTHENPQADGSTVTLSR